MTDIAGAQIRYEHTRLRTIREIMAYSYIPSALFCILVVASCWAPHASGAVTKLYDGHMRDNLTDQTSPEARVSAAPYTHLYFGSAAQGLRFYIFATSQVGFVSSSGGDVESVAHDTLRNKIYWCSFEAIYRSNPDGSQGEMVYNATENGYGLLSDIKFDWISGNVYVADRLGSILICNTQVKPMACAPVVRDQGSVVSIALHPDQRIMFWTTDWTYSVVIAGMDGSGIQAVVTQIFQPTGIAIDYDESKIYWTDQSLYQIWSAGFRGENPQLVLQMPVGIIPFGIAVSSDRIFFGTYQAEWDGNGDGGDLMSCDKFGRDIRTLYDESYTGILYMQLVSLGSTQRSPVVTACTESPCSHVCVPMKNDSFRCFCPKNMPLDADGRTCL